jgi:hypothetical protein
VILALIVGAWTHGVGYVPVTYYITTTGNDSNAGTSGSPWLTPNHAVNCGDVIIRAAGTYSSAHFIEGQWGTVSNCPSSAGIYFASLKCAGPYVTSCVINDTVENGMTIDKSNWAVIGAINSSTFGSCFSVNPFNGPSNIHHIALINVIANGCQQSGIQIYPYWTGPNQYGVDELAIVGAIMYNGAQSGTECYSGISEYSPANVDNNPGTHKFYAGIFSYANYAPHGCGSGANSDGNGFIFDDWSRDQNTSVAYTGQAVLEQSMFLGNGGGGIVCYSNTAASINITSTTTYGNIQDTVESTGGVFGDSSLTYCTPGTGTGTTSLTGSIMQATLQTQNSINVYGVSVNNGSAKTTVSSNYIFGISGQNQNASSSSGFSFSGNTNATPNFVNPVIPGAPSCSSYATTTACMAATIANFVPQAVGAAGLGYQAPSSCTPDAYFPTWLAGVLPIGLITQPCGTN